MSTVTLSASAAEGVSKALDQDVYGVENAERMAWLVLLLKRCDDRPEWFPKGKWATIQHIESQVEAAADNWYELESPASWDECSPSCPDSLSSGSAPSDAGKP